MKFLKNIKDLEGKTIKSARTTNDKYEQEIILTTTDNCIIGISSYITSYDRDTSVCVVGEEHLKYLLKEDVNG